MKHPGEDDLGSAPPPRGQARAALLSAAASLAREHGLAGLAVDRVVERAGLSKGAFFHHFATKRDMVAALLAHLAAEFEADLTAREAGGEGFARALIHATLAEVERNTGFMAALVEAVALDRTLAPVIEARTELWTGRMIDEGMAEGDARLVRAAASPVPPARGRAHRYFRPAQCSGEAAA
jgi:AcrR family transcriptional regulator